MHRPVESTAVSGPSQATATGQKQSQSFFPLGSYPCQPSKALKKIIAGSIVSKICARNSKWPCSTSGGVN
ncbi:hypothetical protein EMIT0373P_10714 [Pseudomonas chlororaphis]